MIDVIKRLAELDAKNPNIVRESMQSEVAECGMMPMPGMGGSSTPASVNITAGSGEELSNMLKDIMSLAGVHQVEPHELGVEPAPVTLTAEPMTVMGPAASAGDEMRAVIDRINGDDAGDEDDEEAKEGQYDNTPTGVDAIPDMDTDAMIDPGRMNQDPAGHPGVGDRMDGDRPKAFATMEESLMDEYKRFVAEDSSEESKKKNDLDDTQSNFTVKNVTTKQEKFDGTLKFNVFRDGKLYGQVRSEYDIDELSYIHYFTNHLAKHRVAYPDNSKDSNPVVQQLIDDVAKHQETRRNEEASPEELMDADRVLFAKYGQPGDAPKEMPGSTSDSIASEGSMDDTSRRIFKRNELQHELGHEVEPAKFAVAIDGRTWKTFDDRRQAENIARSLQAKGKKATVHSA